MLKRNVFYRLVFIVLLVLITQLVFHSCKSKTMSKPSSIGGTCEILVVVDKAKWDSGIDTIIKQSFMEVQDGLPQPEPIFTVVSLPPKSFSDMFKAHRNLFILSISKEHKTPKVEVRKDVWGQPQVIITMNVKDNKTFKETFNKYSASFIEYFDDSERRRLIKAYNLSKDFAVIDKIQKNHNINLIIPSGYYIAKQSTNFVWLKKEPKDYSQGLLISWYDYKDVNSFNPERIVQYRDSLTKLFIPGPSDDSFMRVSTAIPTTNKEVNFNGNYAIEMRGLWRVEGDFMGGPFINYTFVDTLRHRVVFLDGYVYAPKFKKRNYLRQVDAILHSCVITGVKND